MRPLVALGAALLTALSSTAALTISSTPAAAADDDCTIRPGGAITATWPQTRLNFQSAWTLTRGAGVTVAVIDSGIDTSNPQLQQLHLARPGVNVIAGGRAGDVRDCYGHGTAVTGIIGAQPSATQPFLGVAPDATIVAIKQTNVQGDKTGNSDTIAAGIEAAIARHAQVANISVTVDNPGSSLLAAVRDAAAHNLVLVAAAGNDGASAARPAYPAAYSTSYPNVIAVSATDDKDAVAKFSDSGTYVDLAAPGVDVPTPSPRSGYLKVSGTSFAAPYVTGTVALMIAAHIAAHHGAPLSALAIRNRLEATADTPPQAIPSRTYGYGIVNPYLAVTAVRDDSAPIAAPVRAAPLPAPAAVKRADHHLQHVALATAAILAGLAVLAVAGALALRGGPRRRRPVGSAGTELEPVVRVP